MGQWSSAPAGEGLDSPFSCLPLPPATCNLEAQGLDFYYQVLFWLTGSVIIEYERLRYWMRWPPNPRSEAAAVVNARRVRELNGSQACDHLLSDWGPRGHFTRKQLQGCDLLLVIGGKRGEETELYREVVRGQLTWLTRPGSSSQDLEIVTVNSNEFTTFTAPAFVSVLSWWKFLYLHQFQQPGFFLRKSEIAFRWPLSVFTALSCFIYSKSILFSAPGSPFWIAWNLPLKLCWYLWMLFYTRQSKQCGFSIYIFDNSKSKSMVRLVRSEKMALSGLVFARKIARMILIQNI